MVAAADGYLARRRERFGQTYAAATGRYDWGSNSVRAEQPGRRSATAYDLTGTTGTPTRDRGARLPAGPKRPRPVLRHRLRQRRRAEPAQPVVRATLDPGCRTRRRDRSPAGRTPRAMGPALGGSLHGCAPQLCYVDNLEAWSANEITINWNSALTWVAVRRRPAGRRPSPAAGAVAWVVTDPVDVTAVAGTSVELHRRRRRGRPGTVGAVAAARGWRLDGPGRPDEPHAVVHGGPRRQRQPVPRLRRQRVRRGVHRTGDPHGDGCPRGHRLPGTGSGADADRDTDGLRQQPRGDRCGSWAGSRWRDWSCWWPERPPSPAPVGCAGRDGRPLTGPTSPR